MHQRSLLNIAHRYEGVYCAGFPDVFVKLSAALSWAGYRNTDPTIYADGKWYVYSREISKSGTRVFIACPRLTFYRNYISLPMHKRCYYEVIPQENNCKLIFDIEFNKLLNVGFDGELAMDILKTFVIHEIIRVYMHILLPMDIKYLKNENNWGSIFVEKDASNSIKFSRHLIVNLPRNYMFKSILYVGVFVKDLVCTINRECGYNAVRASFQSNVNHPIVSNIQLASTSYE